MLKVHAFGHSAVPSSPPLPALGEPRPLAAASLCWAAPLLRLPGGRLGRRAGVPADCGAQGGGLRGAFPQDTKGACCPRSRGRAKEAARQCLGSGRPPRQGGWVRGQAFPHRKDSLDSRRQGKGLPLHLKDVQLYIAGRPQRRWSHERSNSTASVQGQDF